MWRRLPPIVERIAAGAALCIAFLIMASVFVPDVSHARPELDGPERPAEPSADPFEGLASVGSIEDDRYEVMIHATDDGPLYTVIDRADGTELAVLITAQEVAERFDDLPLPAMDFGVGGPLMLADPPDFPE